MSVSNSEGRSPQSAPERAALPRDVCIVPRFSTEQSFSSFTAGTLQNQTDSLLSATVAIERKYVKSSSLSIASLNEDKHATRT